MTESLPITLASPLLAGRYEFVRPLGEGASGRVVLAIDRVGQHRCAIKIVPPGRAQRLRWEQELLAGLTHPGLAAVHELVSVAHPVPAPWRLAPGDAALVQEFAPGTTASKAISACTDAHDRIRFVLAVGLAVGRALAAVHRAGLIHGDVKPDNIVVAREGDQSGQVNAVLVDLGLARAPGRASELSGTPAYLAPEAWLGERSVATDLFALGTTLAELLGAVPIAKTEATMGVGPQSSVHPDHGARRFTLGLTRALQRAAVDLPKETPPALRRLIATLLAAHPSERPESAAEVCSRIAAVARDLGVDVPLDAMLTSGPSSAEAAARVGLAPLTGREAELEALVAALNGPPCVILVQGPHDAGRTRLIREAAFRVQREAVARSAVAPTFISAVGFEAEEALEGGHHAIVHVESSDEAPITALQARVDSARVGGQRRHVVLECCEIPQQSEKFVVVSLTPFESARFRALLGAFGLADPDSALVDAAREASGGLPGRACRLAAEVLGSGGDLERPATWRLFGQSSSGVTVPLASKELVERLALAHRMKIEPSDAAAARGLVGGGLAHEFPDGTVGLRADIDAATRRDLPAVRAHQIAQSLGSARVDQHGRARLANAQNAPDAADAYLDALTEAKREADPERASAIGLEGLRELPAEARTVQIVLATADALRAQAREREALELLRGIDEPSAIALRAELYRLLGDEERAESECCSITDKHPSASAWARYVRGRLALRRGQTSLALSLCEPSRETEPLLGRLFEVVALAKLQTGEEETALEAAGRAIAVSSEDDPGERARGLAVRGAILHALGRVSEAAPSYEDCFRQAVRAGERFGAASALVNVGLARVELGAVGSGMQALREGARRLTELGRRAEAARALFNLANTAALVGDHALAEETVGTAVVWAREVGDDETSAYSAVVQAELLTRQGKLALALETIERASDRSLSPNAQFLLRSRLAIASARCGRVDRAREVLEKLRSSPLAPGDPHAELAIAQLTVDHIGGEAATDLAAAARQTIAIAQQKGIEATLRSVLMGAEVLESLGDTTGRAEALATGRRLLDQLAHSLPPARRTYLREVPAYAKVLAAGPAEAPGSSDDIRLWRRLLRRSHRLFARTSIKRLLIDIADVALDLSGAERCFVVGDEGGANVVVSRSLQGSLPSTDRPSRSICAAVLSSARPMVTVDAIADGRLGDARSVHSMSLRSVLAVPMNTPEGPAVLYLDDRIRPAAFDERMLTLLTDFAQLAETSMRNCDRLMEERRIQRGMVREQRHLVRQLANEKSRGKALHDATVGFPDVVAESAGMRGVMKLVARVGGSSASVLICGESGVGKEIVARAIHGASPRAERAFVSENCGAIPEGLLESVLFGHVRGAFTGADRDHRGLFEVANGGTLFLDEVGEMSEAMQARLLRVLQEGELRPIGTSTNVAVDVRLIAATNRDLEEQVAAGKFRQDLFYRIAVVRIDVPPLRERTEDIPPLIAKFLDLHAADRQVRVAPDAIRSMRGYRWPGNVRELDNEIQRALLIADDEITREHLSDKVGRAEPAPSDSGIDLKGQLRALERSLIVDALERTRGNQTQAADLLGVSRYGLQKMIKRLGI